MKPAGIGRRLKRHGGAGSWVARHDQLLAKGACAEQGGTEESVVIGMLANTCIGSTGRFGMDLNEDEISQTQGRGNGGPHD
jgi:hypothetical protein